MNGNRFIGLDGRRAVAWRSGIAIALAVAAQPAAAGNPVFPVQ